MCVCGCMYVCMYVISYNVNGHGRLWRLIATGRNTEVFHNCIHIYVYITIVSTLFGLENVGYCLDFFAVIAMTAIRDEDPLMVCDTRRIKSEDLAIPFLLYETRSKISMCFLTAKTFPNRFGIFLFHFRISINLNEIF